MRCNPKGWLWGLIPVAMLAWVATLASRESIESDLAQRVKAVLARQDMNWANVKFNGREGEITGRALEEGEPAKAVASALDTWGVRSITNSAGLVEKVARYHWKAIRDGNRLRLEGHVPSDNARRDIVAAARAAFQGAQVDDKMTLARGAPAYEPWLGGVTFGLKQLALLPKGQLDLEQLELSVRGEAADGRAYSGLKTALASAMPRGIKLKAEQVSPPVVKPYVWTAEYGRGQLALTGSVPGMPARKDMEAVAKKALPRAQLNDQTTYGSGAPQNFGAAIGTILAQLGTLEEGKAEVRDTHVTVSGLAETPAKAEAARAGLRLAGYDVKSDIRSRIPLVSPFVTGARIEGNTVVLTGYVPNEDARRALVATARKQLPGREVRDQLQIGAGEAPTWARCAELGIAALNALGNGSMSLSDQRLEVAGIAPTEAQMQQQTEALRDAAGRDCVAQPRITFDLARAEAESDARRRAEAEARAREEADARRRAEDEARRQASTAAAAAEEARRKAELDARQKADADARAKLDAEARAKQEADARARADAERRRAEADEARRRAELEARAKADAEARAKAETEARRQVAANCQQTMRQVAREGVILFQYARSDIDPKSFATLNKVAEAANRCPEFRIEVEGHTDSDGAPDRNQRLSERRATAVREYLVKAGVNADRVKAIGYGETRPEAPNDTAENKARNRRIEFSVATE